MQHPSSPLQKRLGTLGELLAVLVLLAPRVAEADEPRRATEPHILADSATDLTQVVDAFDEFNDFDLHMSLAFQQSTRRAGIFRETSITQPGLTTGGYGSSELNVANYVESTNRLIPAVQIGLFRDVALRVRLPIILSNTRRLEDREGASQAGVSGPNAAEVPPGLAGLPGERLFSVPFEAPTRSGIEYLAVGLDFGVMNQYRRPALPTWVVGFEGRFNVSEPMRACNANPGTTTGPTGATAPQLSCAHPSDVNRDGAADPRLDPELGRPIEGAFAGGRRPGVSRGTTAFEAHTYVSKRIKYVEPYMGLSGLMEFPTPSSDFGSANLESVASNHMPVRGSLVVGTAYVPWEVRESFQRIALDLRLRGTYVSAGRDYSELFDALGSSNARSLRTPNFADYRPNLDGSGQIDNNNPSVADPNSRRVYFSGLTDVEQHAEYEFSGQFTWQAGEYVKFDVGGAWRIIQSHLITFDRACGVALANDPASAGPCKQNVGSEESPAWSTTGTPNPEYRGVIHDPGNRFRVGTSHGLDAWVRASVMF
jgi:hypothetical protein